MISIFLALGGGLSKSLQDLLIKRYGSDIDNTVIVWSRYVFSIPFVLLLLFFSGIPEIKYGFWQTVLVAVPLEIYAVILYVRAITSSPLSLTIPMLGLSPILIMLTSSILIGELPSSYGAVGILMVAAGIYIVGVDHENHGLSGPVKALFNVYGTKIMLLVAVIYSITPVLAKIGITTSGKLFYISVLILMKSIFMTFIVSKKLSFSLLKKNAVFFIMLSILNIAEFVLVLMAFDHLLVNYVMSLKRSSILFSMMFGYLFFREKNITARLIGGTFIVAGIIVISLL